MYRWEDTTHNSTGWGKVVVGGEGICLGRLFLFNSWWMFVSLRPHSMSMYVYIIITVVLVVILTVEVIIIILVSEVIIIVVIVIITFPVIIYNIINFSKLTFEFFIFLYLVYLYLKERIPAKVNHYHTIYVIFLFTSSILVLQ